MPLPREFTLSPVKVKKIKLILGCRCELCNREYDIESLEVHAISGDRFRGRKIPNLEREILILCTSCHRDIHEACVTLAE